jgi:hypothetical protein
MSAGSYLAYDPCPGSVCLPDSVTTPPVAKPKTAGKHTSLVARPLRWGGALDSAQIGEPLAGAAGASRNSVRFRRAKPGLWKTRGGTPGRGGTGASAPRAPGGHAGGATMNAGFAPDNFFRPPAWNAAYVHGMQSTVSPYFAP